MKKTCLTMIKVWDRLNTARTCRKVLKRVHPVRHRAALILYSALDSAHSPVSRGGGASRIDQGQGHVEVKARPKGRSTASSVLVLLLGMCSSCQTTFDRLQQPKPLAKF